LIAKVSGDNLALPENIVAGPLDMALVVCMKNLAVGSMIEGSAVLVQAVVETGVARSCSAEGSSCMETGPVQATAVHSVVVVMLPYMEAALLVADVVGSFGSTLARPLFFQALGNFKNVSKKLWSSV
jgi:hypothetical protein